MLIKPQIRMEKFTLFLFFIGGLVSMQAQDRTSTHSINDTHKGLILKLGLNLVDSSGEENPFEFLGSFDEMAFSENYNIELEYRFSNSFSLSAGWSRNKWKANKGRIDHSIVSSDIKYSAIDVDLKYYYDEAFGGWFDRNDWFDLYLHGGIGSVSQHDNTSMSMNAGLGSNVWFSERFGLNFNGSAKFLPESGDNLLSSSHFQYSASLMYRFGSNDKDKDDDNDGVKNKDDDCPNVAGVADNNGCPEEVNDSDGDGIPDAIDNCPNEYGTENGCPKEEEETEMIVDVDTDGDSVLDSEDNCPNVKGLPTNNGCPLPDSDNDGIIDSEDKCPTVPGIVAKTSDYNFIAIPSTKKIDFIKIDNILYFESDGRYTIIHLTDNSTFFVSKNIGEYDKILAPKFFFRIHKKYLINLKYIININNSDGSNCQLLGDIILPVAKRRKEDLVSFLNIR